jgi:hypothetical protein
VRTAASLALCAEGRSLCTGLHRLRDRTSQQTERQEAQRSMPSLPRYGIRDVGPSCNRMVIEAKSFTRSECQDEPEAKILNGGLVEIAHADANPVFGPEGHLSRLLVLRPDLRCRPAAKLNVSRHGLMKGYRLFRIPALCLVDT